MAVEDGSDPRQPHPHAGPAGASPGGELRGEQVGRPAHVRALQSVQLQPGRSSSPAAACVPPPSCRVRMSMLRHSGVCSCSPSVGCVPLRACSARMSMLLCDEEAGSPAHACALHRAQLQPWCQMRAAPCMQRAHEHAGARGSSHRPHCSACWSQRVLARRCVQAHAWANSCTQETKRGVKGAGVGCGIRRLGVGFLPPQVWCCCACHALRW